MSPSISATDINTLANFLSHQQIPSLATHKSVDCIVLCPSSVLYSATSLFSTLQNNPQLTKCLILCGGIGYSTFLIYDAIARHETYRQIKNDVIGLPEARVLEMVLNRFLDVAMIKSSGCEILIEDESTNCGSNAIETRKVLEKASIPSSGTFVIIQDPTMSLRTVAAFRKAFSDLQIHPEFFSCPIFIPKVKNTASELKYDVESLGESELWEMTRFVELLLGEIPRLRDDKEGYGPKGKGFIVHVDVPSEVEEAWRKLMRVSRGTR